MPAPNLKAGHSMYRNLCVCCGSLGECQVHLEAQASILQRLYELIIQIFKKTHAAKMYKWNFNYIKILHMAPQLSCGDMCKIVTLVGHYSKN